MRELPPLETAFDLANRTQELEHLEARAAEPGIWDDPAAGTEVVQKLAQLRLAVTPLVQLAARLHELEELLALAAADAEPDAALESELTSEAAAVSAELSVFELQNLLSGPHDGSNAILEINSGAGGTESCDWAMMLLRMYLRWAQERGFGADIVNETPGDVAGLKSVTVVVSGKFAYGYLKSERGVHRLVRISPFDANKRRHTSFASVDVVPEVEESEEVVINADDLRIDTYRSSGAGGQHVNKTDSAVRITHMPTGLVVSCQNERSQHKNRGMAMKVLQSRLMELEMRESAARMAAIRGDQQANEWGSQIRSYTFQPYMLIKDHRTGYESSDISRVMDGALDPFLEAWLQWQAGKGKEAKDAT